MSARPIATLSSVTRPPQYGAIAKGSEAPIGPRFVRQTDITAGRIDWASVPYCDLDLGDFEKYALRPGDLLISRLGNGVGNAATVREPNGAVFAGYLVRFQAEPLKADPAYLGYTLQSQAWRDHVASYSSGAAQPTLNAKQMGAFALPLPPLPEQRAIAASLGALDDKIESNRREIELCEALGASILEDELVLDVYGYPRYGEATLGDWLSLLETGSRPRGGVQVGGGGVPSLGAENIQSAGTVAAKQFKMVSDEFAERMRRGRLADGDVLVYKDGGTPGNFTPHVSAFGEGFPAETATINEHVYRVRATGALSQATLYWLLRSRWMDAEMRKRGTGVAIPGLNQSNFRSLPFPNIGDDGLLRLSERLDPLFRVMLQVGKESQRLSALRDALLPELLSGRIRVPAGEAS